jgi:hypothetical protein
VRTLVIVSLTAAMACSSPAWRPPRDAEAIVVEKDLVVRREEDGAISVLATVTLDGVSAPGWTRLTQSSFERAATSLYADLARARAWQALSRKLEATPERSFEAAMRGVNSLTCSLDLWRSSVFAAENRREQPGGLADGARMMRELLDQTVRHCTRRYHPKAL